MRSQDEARRLTRLLLCGFGLSILLIVALFYLSILAILLWTGARTGATGAARWWMPDLLFYVSLAIIAIVGGGCLYRIVEFRSGGGAVARRLKGRRVFSNSGDAKIARYCNIVEEMAIACGIPVPEVYVLENEPAINAFAAGYTLHTAAIGVTRGALDALSRDELQGVVAHEFSHILNGDMRLNLRLAAVIHGLFVLSELGILLRSPGDERSIAGAHLGGLIFMLVMAIIGIIFTCAGALGVLCGRLLQAAISQQREFLADAAAVQFTRNPNGIAGALRRIAGLPARGGIRLPEPYLREMAHLFFAFCLSNSRSRFFATHPPLLERIRRIESQADSVDP